MPFTTWVREYIGKDRQGTECVWRKLMYRRSSDATVAVLGVDDTDFDAALERQAYPTMLEMAMNRARFFPRSWRPVATCVDTVCDALRKIGVLDADVCTAQWSPDSLTSPRLTSLVGGATFSREIQLRLNEEQDGEMEIEQGGQEARDDGQGGVAVDGAPPEDGATHQGQGAEDVHAPPASMEADDDTKQ